MIMDRRRNDHPKIFVFRNYNFVRFSSFQYLESTVNNTADEAEEVL